MRFAPESKRLMFEHLKQPLRDMIRRAGFEVIRLRPPGAGRGTAEELPADLADEVTLRAVAPYTMTGRERVLSLIDAARYVARYRVPGAVVECGVWRGGSTMAAALTLLAEKDAGRDLYLFDTFEGMPPPTDADVDLAGQSAEAQLRAAAPGTGIWCHAGLDDVRANLASTGYPGAKVHFVKGRVEETIPAAAPAAIALLRLDTDWYESTKHELEHLFPRLAPGGVLIIDDYGYWQGARRATDEYFAAHPQVPLLLHRIDFTGRMAVKQVPIDRGGA